MHLTLIALFETIFFWHIVAPSEDSALINLIQSYTGGLVGTIQAATPAQRSSFANFFDSIVNITQVDAQGASASADRADYNTVLTRDSWLYVIGIAGLSGVLSAAAPIRLLDIQSPHCVYCTSPISPFTLSLSQSCASQSYPDWSLCW
jgi:hypothetical protein